MTSDQQLNQELRTINTTSKSRLAFQILRILCQLLVLPLFLFSAGAAAYTTALAFFYSTPAKLDTALSAHYWLLSRWCLALAIIIFFGLILWKRKRQQDQKE